MSSSHIINPRKPMPRRGPPSRKLSTGIPRYIVLGMDNPMEPHIEFSLQSRLDEEYSLRDPVLPFAADPLPEELPPPPLPGRAHASVQTTERGSLISETLKRREAARVAAEREHRFVSVQEDISSRRRESWSRSPTPRATIHIADGGRFDESLIEDRDYEYEEVVGRDSLLHFRLVSWGGGTPRAVFAKDSNGDEQLVLMLGGRCRNCDWLKDVVAPAMRHCEIATSSIQQTEAEKDAKKPPTLVGGVGHTFNEPTAAPIPLLNTLIFSQLLGTMAMKRLLGFGSGLLAAYCTAAFEALKNQKERFLEHDPRALYPTDSSVYSAVSLELGGPHCRGIPQGDPERSEVASWSILTALGKYSALHGGHIIFWDLGLVVCFPVGASILIPSALVRYSFVKVRDHEKRYSILQYAGAGIGRWFQNGKRTDVEFAVNATAEEHAAREQRRVDAHATATQMFPRPEDLDECSLAFPFTGSIPAQADEPLNGAPAGA
ncbi:hypothetical protein C8R43DRAFT_1117376 [Mycena crocata]|nr:hypothetical protein C8R43DRAFT_1117376 [Mycena crocata]